MEECLFRKVDEFWERKSTFRKVQQTSQVQEIISLEFVRKVKMTNSKVLLEQCAT